MVLQDQTVLRENPMGKLIKLRKALVTGNPDALELHINSDSIESVEPHFSMAGDSQLCARIRLISGNYFDVIGTPSEVVVKIEGGV